MTDLKTTAGKIEDLGNKIAESRSPLGADAGTPAARARLDALMDDGSFVETDALARHRSKDFGREHDRPYTDGVITGYGTINGRKVCVYSQDATVFDGTMGEVYGEKIIKLYDLALKTGVPMVSIVEAGAPRAQEGIVTLAMQARILERVTRASGLIPQVAIQVGELAPLATLAPVMADIVIGEGGHLHAANADEAIAAARTVLGYLPSNNRAEAPRTDAALQAGSIAENISESDRALNAAIADNGSFEMSAIVDALLDDVLELQADVRGISTAFARLEGRTVGLIATAGGFDEAAAEKAARFIRLCDSFNTPIIELVDTPELTAQPARLSKLVQAYAAATVGKLTVVLHRAYGSGYVVMGSKDLGADLAYAWPTAEIAVADATTLASTLGVEEAEAAEFLTPYQAAERGLVDAVIEPAATRGYLIEGLRLLERKIVSTPAKKHSNIVL